MGPEAVPPVTVTEGAQLATIAAGAVRTRLVGLLTTQPIPDIKALHEPGGCFVTLERRYRLRGCVGSLRATRPLYLDAVRNARRAMTDPRMSPVDRTDWPELDVKVSVLTPLTALEVSGPEDLLAVLRPGVDGLVLADDSRQATFLPTVWRRFRDPRRFLAALLTKGGWPEHEWPGNLAIHRYQAYEFCDPAPRDPLTSSDRPERTSPCIRLSQRR